MPYSITRKVQALDGHTSAAKVVEHEAFAAPYVEQSLVLRTYEIRALGSVDFFMEQFLIRVTRGVRVIRLIVVEVLVVVVPRQLFFRRLGLYFEIPERITL